jgi:hypothetical protein
VVGGGAVRAAMGGGQGGASCGVMLAHKPLRAWPTGPRQQAGVREGRVGW